MEIFDLIYGSDHVSVDRTVTGGNTTDVIFVEESVETLSIIVWCVGGVLLITLLALLARIILAKKKHIWDDYETLGSSPVRNRNTLRIFIDARGNIVDAGFPDTRVPANMVHGSSLTTCPSSPESSISCSTINHQRPDAQSASAVPATCSNTDSEILTRHLRVGEYISNLPLPAQSTPEIIPTNNTGSHATVNGVVISPPSYNDVINSAIRIPSVVIDSERTSPRRQLFSL